MNMKILSTGAVIALAASISSTPASAQVACDLNGAAGVPDGAQGTDSLICGNSSSSGGPANNLTAVGVDFSYSGGSVTLLGSDAIVQSNGGFSGSGSYTRPADGGATGVGAYTFVSGFGSVAVGDRSTVGVVDFSSGFSLTSVVNNGTAIGSSSLVTGAGGTAVGAFAVGGGLNGVAIGTNAQTAGGGSTAVGASAGASGATSSAFGMDATATGTSSISFGASSTARALGSIALGFSADATAANAIAIGQNAQGAAADSIALGNSANTGAFTNSVALGANTAATANNQVNVGGRTISGVANGVAATDAVNVSQLTGVNAGIATETANRISADAELSSRLDGLGFDIRDVRNEGRAGTSAALAAAGLPQASGEGRTMIAAGVGTYRGKTALAIGASHRFEGGHATFKAGVTYDSEKHVGANGGVGFEF